jgi:hypothetical protein
MAARSTPRAAAARKLAPAAVDPIDDDDVLDLDAVRAQARQSSTPFVKGGRRYELAPLQSLDYRTVQAADSGDVDAVRAAVKDGLGEEQWEHFDREATSIGELDALFKRWLSKSGLSQGESAASSASLTGTATRSRRTSSARAGR